MNLDASEGELRIEILNQAGQALRTSQPVRGNQTRLKVEWKNANDLSEFAGKPVRLRLHLRSGKLYAFWVSPDESGASYGYVAAGGPGFMGPIDTIGALK